MDRQWDTFSSAGRAHPGPGRNTAAVQRDPDPVCQGTVNSLELGLTLGTLSQPTADLQGDPDPVRAL